MIEGCEVLDESDCDDDCDEDDIDDVNDDNLLKEIREDDRDDDIDKDSNENQEEGESVQEENNFRNLLQTTRYGRTGGIGPSSETQGQLVGSIKCSWWKFSVRSRLVSTRLTAPGSSRMG